MKYRKKPVVIDAIKFIYSTKGIKELKSFAGESLGNIGKELKESFIHASQIFSK